MEECHSSSDFNQKDIVFSVQVVSGDANLTFALSHNSILIISLSFTVR